MNTWICNLCAESLHGDELSDHFRLLHPDIDAQWETTPVVHEAEPYIWLLLRSREWVGVADWAGHALHLPKIIQGPICDAWDKHLGLTDDELERKNPRTPG